MRLRRTAAGVIALVVIILGLGIAGRLDLEAALAGDNPPGECPEGFTKLVDDYTGGPSWTATGDFAVVVLVAGEPGPDRDEYFYDVSEGDVLTRSDGKDISHICVLVTSSTTSSSTPPPPPPPPPPTTSTLVPPPPPPPPPTTTTTEADTTTTVAEVTTTTEAEDTTTTAGPPDTTTPAGETTTTPADIATSVTSTSVLVGVPPNSTLPFTGGIPGPAVAGLGASLLALGDAVLAAVRGRKGD